MRELKYFKYEEFDSPDLPHSGSVNMDPKFMDMLEAAREIAGIPFIITSGYRTKEHNDAIGSKSTNHTTGRAADIAATNSRDRFIIISALIEVGFNRIGIDFKRKFIHVDSNGTDYGGDSAPDVFFGY